VTAYRATGIATPLGEMIVVVSDDGVVWTMFSDENAALELEPAASGGAGPLGAR
jgi:hypothetical protein